MTESRIENKNDQKNNIGNNNSDRNMGENNMNRREYNVSNYQYGNRSQSIENGKQQYIPKASSEQQR